MLYELSYANLILLGATFPDHSRDSDKDKAQSGGAQDVIDAGDPKNRNIVRDFLKNVD